MNKANINGFVVKSININGIMSDGVRCVNEIPVLPETYKEFHGHAYKPELEPDFYGEIFRCYICGNYLESFASGWHYCPRCGNEIDWTKE